MEQVVFPIKELLPRMVVNVKITGVRTLALRMKVGGWLIKVAALVMGMGLHVEVDN